jgi:PPE-repeat protein
VNVSKIQKVLSEVLAVYQATVPGSAWASGHAPPSSSATAAAFSGLATRGTTKAYGAAHLLPPVSKIAHRASLGTSGATARPVLEVVRMDEDRLVFECHLGLLSRSILARPLLNLLGGSSRHSPARGFRFAVCAQENFVDGLSCNSPST